MMARNASNCACQRDSLEASALGTHEGLFAMGTGLCGNTTELSQVSKLNMYILSHSSKLRRSFCWQLSVICVIEETMTNSFTMWGSSKCNETDYFAMCATVSTFLPADEFIRWYHSKISLQKHMAH